MKFDTVGVDLSLLGSHLEAETVITLQTPRDLVVEHERDEHILDMQN